MSFDQTFNYTDAKTYLNDKISNKNAEIQNIDEELSILENLSTEYQTMTINRTTHLINKKAALVVSNTRLVQVVSEIIAVESLSVEDKAILYNFYITFIEPDGVETTREYMRRIIHNSNNLVTVASVLLNDANISDAEIKYVVELIRETNPIERDTFSLVHSLK